MVDLLFDIIWPMEVLDIKGGSLTYILDRQYLEFISSIMTNFGIFFRA